MVSLRCKMLVEEELNRLNIPYLKVELGVVEMASKVSDDQ